MAPDNSRWHKDPDDSFPVFVFFLLIKGSRDDIDPQPQCGDAASTSTARLRAPLLI